MDMIKEYFMNYYIYASEITVDLSTNKIEVQNNKTATIIMAKPSDRNQFLPVDSQGILCYEQPDAISDETAWVNAKCFVFQRKIFDYLDGNLDLEEQLLPILFKRQQTTSYQHKGFWKAIKITSRQRYVR